VKRIVEFPLESGGSILVEVDEPALTDDRIGLRDEVAQKAQKTFDTKLRSNVVDLQECMAFEKSALQQ
jgi:hypothetical protein